MLLAPLNASVARRIAAPTDIASLTPIMGAASTITFPVSEHEHSRGREYTRMLSISGSTPDPANHILILIEACR
jgi:hypothetical protein